MAKRFTDTDKWKKSSLKRLPAAYKLFWLYICDDCDHAGIWHVDFDIVRMRLNEQIEEDTALKLLGDKVVVLDNGDKWFLPTFVEFQYGELKENNRVHQSVLMTLAKNGIDKNKGLISPLQGCKDKYKDKDKDKGEPIEKNQSWPKPTFEDGGDLKPDQIRTARERVGMHGKSQIITEKQVIESWSIFKNMHLNGVGFYQNIHEVVKHFYNWIPKQTFSSSADKPANTSSAPPLRRLQP